MSIVMRVLICAAYAGSSSCLTMVNRMIYSIYNYKSPLSLLFVQCLCNVTICLILMSIKSFVSATAFDFMKAYGIKLSSLGEVAGKAKAGLMISAVKIIDVLFGLYSLKAVNIPLFLTFRRCAMVTTIIVDYFVGGKTPSQTLLISAFFVVVGALIAGYETFDSNAMGYILIMGNNFSSAFANVVTAVYNEKKVVQAFDLNFYFALIGLPLSFAITS